MQNWNNLLDFIKTKLGANINLLEISDDQIMKEIKEHCLYEFSQYCPYKKRIKITASDKIDSDIGEQSFVYKIPIADDEPIIDVIEIVVNDNASQYTSTSYDTITSIQETNAVSGISSLNADSYFGIQDIFMMNKVNDIVESLQARNTWDFLPPDMVSFDSRVNFGVVIINTVHKNLSTISPDLYHIFKRMALGYIQETLAITRSKYEELNTAFGQIRVNWQKLQDDANANLQFARETLEKLPPDHFVYVCI